MTILALVLAVNAVLHVLVLSRFGLKGNIGFLVYAIIYAALAVGVFLGGPHVLWVTLVLGAIGFLGQLVQLKRDTRDKTLDWAVAAADAATLLCTFISCSQNRAHEKTWRCASALSIQRSSGLKRCRSALRVGNRILPSRYLPFATDRRGSTPEVALTTTRE